MGPPSLMKKKIKRAGQQAHRLNVLYQLSYRWQLPTGRPRTGDLIVPNEVRRCYGTGRFISKKRSNRCPAQWPRGPT